MKKSIISKTLLVAAVAGTIGFSSAAFAETYPTTLDTIKSNEVTYLSGTHTKYTLTTTKGSNTHSVKINGTTYYYTPNAGDTNVVTLANTGSVALKTTTVQSEAVFDISGTLYTYDTAKLPTSGYTLTKVDAKSSTSITIPEYDPTTKTLVNKYYEMTLNKTTYGSGSSSKTVTIKIPTNKDVTITGNYDSTGNIRIDTDQSGANLNRDFMFLSVSSDNGGAINTQANWTIGNITGDFIGNYSSQYGGAIYNNKGTMGNISGTFINNYVNVTSGLGGGAIYNNTGSTIGNITGHFIGNYANTYGGSIYNHGVIDSVTGDFIGNYSSKYGGAIYNTYAKLANITGDFVGNYAGSGGAIKNESTTIGDITGNFIKNYVSGSGVSGGAINNNYSTQINNITGNFIENYANGGGSTPGAQGGAIYNCGGINTISGNFIGNYTSASGSASGGAIYHDTPSAYDKSIIKNIIAVFIGNYASSTGSLNSYSYGGAIYNSGGKINNITSDFIENYASSTNNYSYGGAIYNEKKESAKIDNITGNFIGNYAKAPIAQGGAIYNHGTIGTIQSNFVNNYVQGETAQGGAIYTTQDLTILANNRTTLFSGNYVTTDGINKDYQAIYAIDGSTLNLQTMNNGIITFDDKIAGNNYHLNITGDNTGTANLNNYINPTELDISATNVNILGAALTYSIANSTVLHQTNITNGSTGILNVYDITLSGLYGNLLNQTYKIIDQSDDSLVAINIADNILGNHTLTLGKNSYSYTISQSENDLLLNFISQNLRKICKTTEVTDPEEISANNYNYFVTNVDGTKNYYNITILPQNIGILPNNVTWSTTEPETATGNVVVNLPNDKTTTLYYTANATSQKRVSNGSSTLADLAGTWYQQNSESSGGAIYNYGSSAKINSITGDFIGNYARSTSSNTFGGAIYNYQKCIIGNITGDFVGNYASSTNGYTKGGTIYNMMTIGDIIGDFIGNYASSTNSYAEGGAIWSYDGEIGNITGDFINNYVTSTNSYASGGAIYNYASQARINSITGDFINNYASSTSSNAEGGAIYNYSDTTICDITGDFVGNYVQGAIAVGGAIYNSQTSTIVNITSDFINNYAKASNTAYGGAIYNTNYNGSTSTTYYAIIKNITGNFIGNYVSSTKSSACGGAIHNAGATIENITSDFISNYASSTNSSAIGGAIYNSGVAIENITGSFIGNYAQGTTVKGGAIYTTKNLSFLADNKTNTFKGNYVTTNGGTTKNYEAIYVDSYSAKLTFNAKNNGKFELYDNINGASSYTVALTGDKTGTFGMYNDIKNANITAENITVDTINNEVHTYNINKMTLTGSNVKLTLDVDVTNELADNFNAKNKSSGKFLISAINVLNPIVKTTDTIQVVNKNVTLSLADALKTETILSTTAIQEYTDVITPTANFDDKFYHHVKDSNVYGYLSLAQTNYANDSIKVTITKLTENDEKTSLGDTLSLVNTLDTTETKNFNFKTATDEYTATAGAGETKGTLNINGVAFETSKSTIDFDGNDGFIVKSGNTLNITDTKLTNYSGKAITNSGDVTLTNTEDITYEENTIYLNTADSKLTLNINNGSEVTLNNAITGVNGASVEFTGDNTGGALRLNNDLSNMNVSMGNISLNGINDTINNYNFNKFTLTSDVNMGLDIDLANSTMDTISANSYELNGHNLNIVGMNLLSDAITDKTIIPFADADLRANVINMVSTVGKDSGNPFQSTAFSPVYKYGVGYNTSTGDFTFEKQGINPAVVTPEVAQQVGVISTQNQVFNYGFHHSNVFMNNPAYSRTAEMMRNQYAINDSNNLQYHTGDRGAWFTPYVSFESVPLNNGPTVNNISYGALVGYDSEAKSMKHGWSRVWTGYAGYNGATLNYSGNDIYQNGGLLGATFNLYKGNFFNATTVSVGAINSENKTMYGTDNNVSLMAGIGNRTGYNFEFKEGKYIIQPSLLLAYTFVNTFNYTNAAGVHMESDPLHTIQIAPALKFIMNTKTGWQPYATVGMMWNIMDQTHFRANNVILPSTSIKPYVYYGLGVQKQVKDNFTAYGQALVHNGGRNGVALTAGFKWMIGRDNNKNIQKVHNKYNQTSYNSQKHLIK